MVVRLQLEVARRLVAGAGDEDYGVLSLLAQLPYEAQGHFKIPADCFFPAPEVDSACVILGRREKPRLPPEIRPAFTPLGKLAFSERRKMVVKILKQDWPAETLEAGFLSARFVPQIRG